MTKELLEQYPDICGERDYLMNEIDEADKLDALTAFSLRLKNASKIAELSAKKASVETFLNALPWGKRRLVRAVLKCGTRWDVVRRELTKALQQSAENERMHGHAYSTYTNCIYKTVFGLDAKKLREKFGVGRTEKLRDSFSAEELAQVEVMERLVSSLVDLGWGYERVKEFISGENIKTLAA